MSTTKCVRSNGRLLLAVAWLWMAAATLRTSPDFGDTRQRLPLLSSNHGNESLETDRDDRILFTIIRFPNDLCGSGTESGTCFTSKECSENGGTTVTTCAKGYGSCCKVTSTSCGGDIRVNNTWVQNPEYPDYFNEARTCTWNVYFDDTDGRICQIRYDFGANTLVGPSTTGYCNNDQLIFHDDTKSEWFCGVAPDNYHWYVETTRTTSPHSFTIKTDSTSFNRRYAIRVSFVPCSVGVMAKCGQYFTGLSGTIHSYNYNQKSYYLAGLAYSMCFRKEKGYCTYTLKKTSNNQYIDANDELRLLMGEGIVSPPNPAIAGSSFLCPQGSVQHAHLYYTTTICYYPDSMTSVQTMGPFYVTMISNLDTTTNVNPLPPVAPNVYSGFEFDWTHNACT